MLFNFGFQVKWSDQCCVACDVAIHGFQKIGASGCRRQIEFLIERENFKGVVVRDWDLLWRTRGPVAKISALSGEAVGLVAAVRQIRVGRGNICRKLIRGWRHIPDHPVQNVIDALSRARLHVMHDQGKTFRASRRLHPLQRR